MKKFLVLFLTFALAIGALAGSILPPKGFEGTVWSSTLALYGSLNNRTHFDCTTQVVGKTEGGYLLLSAGHCVQDIPAGVQFSVSDNIGSDLYPVQLVKAFEGGGIDFSLFSFKTKKVYRVLDADPVAKLRVGERVLIVNFTEGLGKQLSRGIVASDILAQSRDCASVDTCEGDFLVQAYGGPGASGSAVISEKTHKIIGVAVFGFDGTIGFGVEPISKMTTFLQGPNQPHPTEDVENGGPLSPAANPVLIPNDVFVAQFGSAHPFMLTVHGPNPAFTQGGYKFVADTDGFELSDDYYYNVPVFVNVSSDGYLLESTKDGVSVILTVVGKE